MALVKTIFTSVNSAPLVSLLIAKSASATATPAPPVTNTLRKLPLTVLLSLASKSIEGATRVGEPAPLALMVNVLVLVSPSASTIVYSNTSVNCDTNNGGV